MNSKNEGHEMHKGHHEMKHDGPAPSKGNESQEGMHGMEHDNHEMHDKHGGHKGMGHMGHGGPGGGNHHGHMVADFRKRFWISLIDHTHTVFIPYDPVLHGIQGIPFFSRRSIHPVGPFFGRLLLWRVALSQRSF